MRTGFEGVEAGGVPLIDGARALTFSILEDEPALASLSSFFFFSPFLNMLPNCTCAEKGKLLRVRLPAPELGISVSSMGSFVS